MKWKTMCSAPTREGLEKLINEYFCSTNYRIAEDNATVINIGNGMKWDEADGYKVKQRKGRWCWLHKV